MRRRPRRLAYEYMANYYLSIMKHYELMSEHFKGTKGYEFYGNASDALRAVGLENSAKIYTGIQAWGTPEQLIEKLRHAARAARRLRALADRATTAACPSSWPSRASGCSRAKCCPSCTAGRSRSRARLNNLHRAPSHASREIAKRIARSRIAVGRRSRSRGTSLAAIGARARASVRSRRNRTRGKSP